MRKKILFLALIIVALAAAGCGSASSAQGSKQGDSSSTGQGSGPQGNRPNGRFGGINMMQIVDQYAPDLKDRFQKALQSQRAGGMRSFNGQADQGQPMSSPPANSQPNSSPSAQRSPAGMGGRGINPTLLKQLNEAVTAKDQTKIKDLLTQILTDLEKAAQNQAPAANN